MKKLFDELSNDVSKKTTRKYSTSFSLGILALKPSIRNAIYAIYGYVRLADEIVDSFHDYDKKALIKRLKIETETALREGISLNPILNSFQDSVKKYGIDEALIWHFLYSMEMDLEPVKYTSKEYEQYIYGSAEVVGLMCLQVFTEGRKSQYEELKPYAQKLGSAFQKVNFLRDLKDDYHVLGRTYFPNIELSIFDGQTKDEIEKEIENEFKEALAGIRRLPSSSRFGVYLAYKYYLELFRKIKTKTPEKIMEERIRIPNYHKFSLTLKSYIRYKTTLL